VLRVWNNNVSHNLEGVLEAIHAALYGSRTAEARELKHFRLHQAGRHTNHGAPTLPLQGRVERLVEPSGIYCAYLKWHATICPGRTSRSAGDSTRQRSTA
jgi:hypothetical protein